MDICASRSVSMEERRFCSSDTSNGMVIVDGADLMYNTKLSVWKRKALFLNAQSCGLTTCERRLDTETK